MDIRFAVLIMSLSAESIPASQFPQNAAFLVGEPVIFHCRTDSNRSIWWKFKSTSTATQEELISKDGNISHDFNRYFVNTTEPGQFDLHINYTRLSDAGTYFCLEDLEDATAKHESELVVLGSLSDCNTNLSRSNAASLEENDSVLMWCTVEFRGNLNPVMKWINGINKEVIHSRTTVILNKQVSSEIVVQVNYSEQGVAFSCSTYFDQTSIKNLTMKADDRLNTPAKNIPDYNYTWTSPALIIFVLANESIPTSISTINPPDVGSSPSPTTSSASASILMVFSFVVVTLLCIAIFCCTAGKRLKTGCFQKTSAEPSVLSEANIRADRIYYEDQTEGDGLGSASSQVGNPVLSTGPRVTFRQNTTVPFYEETASDGDDDMTSGINIRPQQFTGRRRTAVANAVPVFYEDPIQTANERLSVRRIQNRSLTTTASAPSAQAAMTQVNDHIYSAEPVLRITSSEEPGIQDNANISTADPQLSYVGSWMEGAHGGNSGSLDLGPSTYDYVDIYRLRSIRSQETPRPQVDRERPIQNVGTDGTVYIELNATRENHVPPIMQQREPIQTMFNTSVYAPIDHTAQNIPPPRPPKTTTPQAISSYR